MLYNSLKLIKLEIHLALMLMYQLIFPWMKLNWWIQKGDWVTNNFINLRGSQWINWAFDLFFCNRYFVFKNGSWYMWENLKSHINFFAPHLHTLFKYLQKMREEFHVIKFLWWRYKMKKISLNWLRYNFINNE